MKVNITYLSQVKKAAGISTEDIECDPCAIQDFIIDKVCSKNDDLRHYILGDHGVISETIVVFRGDTKINLSDSIELKDGDELTIMTPIAGG